jgi:glycosyltransferase involved in cell wall biosynthesis
LTDPMKAVATTTDPITAARAGPPAPAPALGDVPPVRVLHLYAGNLFGGVERLLLTLCGDDARRAGLEQEFGLCFEGRLADGLRARGAAVHQLGEVRLSRPWTALAARRALRRLLDVHRFDVAVCHSTWPHVVFGPVLRRRGLPLVFWMHGIPDGRHWLERLAKRTRPDLVLANSRYTAFHVPLVFPGVPAEVQYAPVAPAPASPVTAARQLWRTKLGTSIDSVVIVMPARLEAWKGHTLLIDALQRLPVEGNWECWIAGAPQRPAEEQFEKELRETVRRQALDARVRFLGHVDDVPSLLRAADVHCQPNLGAEPFGIAFVEALYAGLPVVTTGLGAAPEIVDARCGILVPPGDAAGLAAALWRLMGDAPARVALGRNGPAKASLICDPPRVFAQIAGTLRHLTVSPTVGRSTAEGAA